ncbi:hypothetical protein Ocin01_17893 [Orchesella cincta]|uniref:Protein quiver n=1 Tax=Orchesella cincta TaxID=48709 RepID=A0A1D2M741_ORCCI|nr:hypothetical protein Ocin01_17893 [Orchesella cincta]
MKMKQIILIVVVWLFLVDLQVAQGIKCYECYQCEDGWSGVEKECGEEDDRCLMTKDKDGGWINKMCTRKGTEDYAKIQKAKCDDFGKEGQKWCFCDTDLCNDMEISGSSGYSRRHLFFTVVVSFVVNFFL